MPHVLASSGSFLVSPDAGLMIWTLITFGASLLILRRFVFPRIQDALDKRQRAIEESIDHSEQVKREADELLADYRERLHEARGQADEIVSRAQQTAKKREEESALEARRRREELMEQTRRDIDQETKRAIQEIRKEVAGLTVLATEKVTRKTLDADDQRRLVDEALGEIDFTTLTGEGRNN